MFLILVYIYHLGKQFEKNFEIISLSDTNGKEDYKKVSNKFILRLYGINYGLKGIFKYEIFYICIWNRKYLLLIFFKLCVIGLLAYSIFSPKYIRSILFPLILLVFLPLLLSLNEKQLKNFNLNSSFRKNMNLNRIFVETYFYIIIYLFYIIVVNIALNIKNILNIISIQNSFLHEIHEEISLIYVTLTIGFLIVFYAVFSEEIFLNREKMLKEIRTMIDKRINKYHEFKEAIFDLFFNFDPFDEYQTKVKRGINPEDLEFKILLYSPALFFLISIFFLCYPIFAKKFQDGYPTWDLNILILCILFTFYVFYVLIRKYKEYLQIKSEKL
ncbi:MAG TPA: hypothetical protein ENI51_05340 [Candidatus Atribacteria bacterium]|nr:hypothetical protein [Candidatus Atribacteria bacterium]